MKRISLLVVALAVGFAGAGRAQDAATQERLERLSGQIENLTEAQAALRKQISDLSRELENVREQMGKPSATYARAEELTQLRGEIKAVDRKRVEDAETVRSELLKLRRALEAQLSPPRKSPTPPPKQTTGTPTPAMPEKVFEYVVQSGDTLDAIVQAYREKNIRVTVAQVLKANEGLKPERLRVGQKIYIPAP